ncbi:MAG: PKD domain-containing protein [Myxococcaceae bacterium]|nr:PKD domain-containing protein [Myxococcaceae bacterium]
MRRLASWMMVGLLFGGLLSSAPACVPLCTPGAEQACTCNTGAMGSQLCRSDGYFDPCRCAPGFGTGGSFAGGFAAAGGFSSAGGFASAGGSFGFGGGGNPGFAGGAPTLTMPPTYTVVVGQPLTLSIEVMSTPTSWSWTVTGPDGGAEAVTAPSTDTPSFTPRAPGTYRVDVTAANSNGQASTNFPLVAVEARVLPFTPTAVAHHRETHRLALGRDSPPGIELYDVRTGQAVTVPLMRIPLALAFSPDGAQLVAGQVSQVQVVSFVSGAAPTVVSWPIASTAESLGVGTSHAYWTTMSGSGGLGRLDLRSGAVEGFMNGRSAQHLRLHPDEERLYVLEARFSSTVTRIDLYPDGGSFGSLNRFESSQSGLDCSELWMTRDSTQLVTGCGSLYRLSALVASDLTAGGRLPQATYRGLDEADDGGTFVALQQPLDRFNTGPGLPVLIRARRDTLLQSSVRALPSRMTTLSGTLVGRHVFVDDTNTAHVLLVAGPGLPTPRTVWVTLPMGGR